MILLSALCASVVKMLIEVIAKVRSYRIGKLKIHFSYNSSPFGFDIILRFCYTNKSHMAHMWPFIFFDKPSFYLW